MLCILIGILLYILLNNIDRFSIGVPSFFINRIGSGVNPPSPEFISPDGNANNARINYMNPTTGQIETLNFYEYMERENQQARDNGETLPYPDPGNFEIIQEAELEQQEVCATRGNLELRRIETPLPQTENDIDNIWIQLTLEQQQLIRELYMNSELYQLVPDPPDQEVFFRDRLEGTGNPPRIFWDTITFGDQPIIIRGLDLYRRTLQLFDETVVSRFLWIMRIDSDFKTDPNLEPPILVEEGIPPDPSVRPPDQIQIQTLNYADGLDWDNMDPNQQAILGHLGWNRDTWQAGDVTPFFIEEDLNPMIIQDLLSLGFSDDFIQDFESTQVVQGQILDVDSSYPQNILLPVDSGDSTSRYSTWLIRYNIETGKIIHIRNVTSENIFFDNPDVDQIRRIDSQVSNIQTYLVRIRTTRGVPHVSRYFLRNINTATPYTFYLGGALIGFNSTMDDLNDEQRQYLTRLGFNENFVQPTTNILSEDNFNWLLSNGFDRQWVIAIGEPDDVLPTGATVPGDALPTGATAGINTTWNQLSSTQRRRFISIYRDSSLRSIFGTNLESAWNYVRSEDIPDGRIRTIYGNTFSSAQMQSLRDAGFTEEIINKFNHN